MVWIKEVSYPYGIASGSVKKEAFDSFVRQFNLSETFNKRIGEFFNVQKFMEDGCSPSTSNYFGNSKHRLLPEGYSRHTAAYKDTEGHVLVLSLSDSSNEKRLERTMRDRGWVAVLLTNSHRIYPGRDMYVVSNAETYEHFDSRGCFVGWADKVLR